LSVARKKPEKLNLKVDLARKICQINPTKEVDYLGSIGSDTAFVVFYDADSLAAATDYSVYHCFMGPVNNLKEYRIIDFLRFRDGGTTQIIIEDPRGTYYEAYHAKLSTFFFPFIWSGPDSSTFNQRRICRF